ETADVHFVLGPDRLRLADRAACIRTDEGGQVPSAREVVIENPARLDLDEDILVAGNLASVRQVVAETVAGDVAIRLRAHRVAPRPEPMSVGVAALDAARVVCAVWRRQGAEKPDPVGCADREAVTCREDGAVGENPRELRAEV